MINCTQNPNAPIENLLIGEIIEVDGLHIVAELRPELSELSRVFGGEIYTIGQFGSIIKIHFGKSTIYAYVGRLRMKAEYQAEKGITQNSFSDERIIEADLFGEGKWHKRQDSNNWELLFERGVSTYPLPMQSIYITPSIELKYIYGKTEQNALLLGEHVGSGHTPCYVDFNELLCKHTAIVGSTGSGKSCTVASVLHSIISKKDEANYENWLPRIIILDPHGEYGQAFSEHLDLSTDKGTLRLPYWLLNFQEIIALLIGKTEFIATSQANIIKSALSKVRSDAALSLGIDPTKITIDSPVPFHWNVFINHIENMMPSQDSKKEPYLSIINKLDILRKDKRFEYMMHDWDGQDSLISVIEQFMGSANQPHIVNLSGVPNEVAGIAGAVIARTLFNYKIWQTDEERKQTPILLVCEEAHRYVPNRGEAQYEAAQDAIRRIAKEGRKYGIGLFLISQRPSELDPTVLSQCNTWIILRLTNDTDISFVKAVLPDALSGLTSILSGLKRQEALLLGQATLLPSRVRIRDLSKGQKPQSEDIDFEHGWQQPEIDSEVNENTIRRWRYQNYNLNG